MHEQTKNLKNKMIKHFNNKHTCKTTEYTVGLGILFCESETITLNELKFKHTSVAG